MKISLPCYLLWSDMCYLQYFLYTTIYCNCVVQITFAGLGIASILYVVGYYFSFFSVSVLVDLITSTLGTPSAMALAIEYRRLIFFVYKKKMAAVHFLWGIYMPSLYLSLFNPPPPSPYSGLLCEVWL